jgi:hypothetical protein
MTNEPGTDVHSPLGPVAPPDLGVRSRAEMSIHARTFSRRLNLQRNNRPILSV